MTNHAVLSASGAERWINCTPSAVLEAEKPDTSSTAAEQGTAAHELAEHKFKLALKIRSRRPRSDYQDDEMERYTTAYRDFVLETLAEVKEFCADPVVMLEQRLDFSHLVPGGFGTGDCVIVADGVLHIIDLKYGVGVLVDAWENPQMALYGLGALNAFDSLYDIVEVRMTIFQPRRDNTSTWIISADELRVWGETVARPAAELAAVGAGEFVTGPWCGFCKLAPTCRARAEENLALAQLEFKPGPELSDEEITEVLGQSPDLVKWAKDVEKYALQAALNQGKTWPGFKLVEGRSIRKYTDEAEVAKALAEAEYHDVWEKKLLGVTAMEKYVGKKEFTEILGDLVIKPAGNPTLVPESDKRPALHIASAEQEFTEVKENENDK